MAPKKAKDDKKDEAPQEVQEDSGTFMFGEHNAKYSGQLIRRDGILYRNGVGTFASDSLSYEGGWKDDMMHGEGVLTFHSDGSTYSGGFVDGQFDGSGTFTWPSGAVYEGQWRMNRMHGEGQYTDTDGVVWSGKFYNGTGPGLRRASTI